MPLPDPFEAQLAAAWPVARWQKEPIVVAVSGGPDSMALLRALLAVRGMSAGMHAAHFNHRWRGAPSDRDEQFVRQSCANLQIPCHVEHAPPPAAAPSPGGQGREATARKLRYAFLIRVAQQQAARYVVTGHTADDQVETILHHVLRGTGLAGLSGIPRTRRLTEAVTLLRPLLHARRADVLAYLQRCGQPACTDDTNAQLHFTRNRVRHRLLPLLEEDFNPQVHQALWRLGQVAGQAQEALAFVVERLCDQHVRLQDPQTVWLDRPPLAPLPLYLQCELFRAIWRDRRWPQQQMTFEHWQRLAQMLTAEAATAPQRQTMPGAVDVCATADHVILTA